MMRLEARGIGLLLWRYLGGLWEQIESFEFMGDDEK